jgi:hypothetical protein
MRTFSRLSRGRRIIAHVLLIAGVCAAIAAWLGYIPARFGLPLGIAGMLADFFSLLYDNEETERSRKDFARGEEDSKRLKRIEEKLDRNPNHRHGP